MITCLFGVLHPPSQETDKGLVCSAPIDGVAPATTDTHSDTHTVKKRTKKRKMDTLTEGLYVRRKPGDMNGGGEGGEEQSCPYECTVCGKGFRHEQVYPTHWCHVAVRYMLWCSNGYGYAVTEC